MSFSVTLPIKVSANARGHTIGLSPKVKAHRGAARLAVSAAWRIFANRREAQILDRGLVVTLTRVAPRVLDDDNLRTSLKSPRDGVADALGLKSDRDPRIQWLYRESRAGVREYAVVIVVSPRPLQ